MKLTELQRNKASMARKALKEHFEMNIDLRQFNQQKTRNMLSKVRGLLKEARQSSDLHVPQTNSSYLKLVMMEQMLSNHYQDIRVQSRVVVENEEVEKSQVILAAQDLVDQVQKMIEQVSKMNAEELASVTSGIAAEIGSAESQSYNEAVSAALITLQGALSAAKGTLTGSLGELTGQGGGIAAPEADGDLGGDEFGDEELAPEMPDLGGEEDFEMSDEIDVEEPESAGPAGRELR
jgi:hypothetical protein